MQRSNKNLAGLLLFAGSTIGFLGIIIAETQYPNYSTANNFISDLGIGPSAAIFNFALIIGGLLGTTGAYFLSRSLKNRLFPVLVGLSSLGSVFVGVFPEDTGIPHAIAALLAFIAGGVAAIISYRYLKTPFRYVSVALGALSLLSFILFLTGIHLGLGAGGMERMIAYPNIIWSIGFGGNLMADSTETK
jgi:hypothetical membrane protein